MGYARVQVGLRNDSLLPADIAMNTWHFVTPGDPGDVTTEVATLLEAFYDAIGTYLSNGLNGTADVKLFDLEDPSPRPPVGETTFTFSPSAGQTLPHEVALAMSFQGPVVAGTAQARRRGRLFLGPFDADAQTTAVGDSRPSGTMINAIVAAAETLMTDTTTPGLIWSVFSPTTAGPPPWSSSELANAFVTVTNGWIDNAWDTVRSRGTAATSRTVWP